MAVGNDTPFSRVANIVWISVVSLISIAVLATLVLVLTRKRKVTVENDIWLEQNKEDIMNEVMLHERFLKVYDQLNMQGEEVDEDHFQMMNELLESD